MRSRLSAGSAAAAPRSAPPSCSYCAASYGISSVPSSSMPTEKSLQPCARDTATPACHARAPNGTYCTISPSRRISTCADTRAGRDRRESTDARPAAGVGEQPVDPRPAELAGRQADAVHDDEIGHRSRRAARRSGRLAPAARAEQRARWRDRSADARWCGARGLTWHPRRMPDNAARRNCDATDACRESRSDADRQRVLAARDLAHVWHPCTQMKDHETLPMIPIARGEGVWLYDFDGRRYLDAISSWWVNLFGHCQPAHQRRDRRAARPARARDARRLHARAGRRAGRTPGALAPAGPHALLLRATTARRAIEVALKMSFHYWRNRGHAAEAPLRHAGEQLSRRDARRARGQRRASSTSDIYEPLLLRRDHRAVARTATSASPARAGQTHSRRSSRPWKQALARARATKPRRSSSSRWCSARPACACTTRCICSCCATPATARRAPDRRRDRRRLRPHRHDVRVRAGRHPPGFPVPVERPHRRLPAAVGRADAPTESTRRSTTSTRRCTRFLHSHSYTGNPLACTAALATLDDLPRRRRDRAQPRSRGASRRARPGAAGSSARRRSAPARHDRRDRAGARQEEPRALSTGRNAAASGSIGTGSSAGCCCGRSATSSISCRRT